MENTEERVLLELCKARNGKPGYKDRKFPLLKALRALGERAFLRDENPREPDCTGTVLPCRWDECVRAIDG